MLLVMDSVLRRHSSTTVIDCSTRHKIPLEHAVGINSHWLCGERSSLFPISDHCIRRYSKFNEADHPSAHSRSFVFDISIQLVGVSSTSKLLPNCGSLGLRLNRRRTKHGHSCVPTPSSLASVVDHPSSTFVLCLA